MNILKEVTLGEFYFVVAVLLRETVFLSKLLLNSETWVNLTKADIEELESADRLLLRRFLDAPVSSPKSSLYLELGLVPVKFKIKAKRILYLHYILTSDQDETLAKVFWAQKKDPIEGDWWLTIQNDLCEFGLDHYSLNDIQQMKKEKFKEIVKEKCTKSAFDYLISEKQKQTKMENLNYVELKMQNYLKSNEIFIRKKKVLYKFRTRMINVGYNYGRKIKCSLCGISDDTQHHLFQCNKLETTDFNYMDIFGSNPEKQNTAALVCDKVFRERETLLQKN